MALYDNDGNVIPETVGTTVEVRKGYSYWGDGMGTYYTEARIWTGEEFKWVRGESQWDYMTRYHDQNVIDAPADVQVAFNKKVEADRKEAARQKYNRDVYEVRQGRYAIILRGKTKARKNQGMHGTIIKMGTGQWGPWVLLKGQQGDTYISNERYIAIIPDWEDAWEGVDTDQVA